MEITAHTRVGNLGQTVTALSMLLPQEREAAWRALTPGDFALEDAFVDASRLVPATQVEDVGYADGVLTLGVAPFRHLGPAWRVRCTRDELSFGRDDLTRVITRTADAFVGSSRDGIPFRLYTPAVAGPRPLLLFLHGGGEGGTDNWLQLVGTLGAAAWAERYPDLMVLAPQNPIAWDTIRAALGDGRPAGAPMPGWSVQTLAVVASVIRDLIASGDVDPARVYVSGMSMGGAGTLRMLAHHRDLFAGAAPICPSMNEETLPYLKGMGDMPVWISSAYRDTFPTRHLQIIEGIEHLQAGGSGNAHCTLYSAEELAVYGLGCNPSLTEEQGWGENHHSWVLTLNNAYGMMDWLMAQRRNDA